MPGLETKRFGGPGPQLFYLLYPCGGCQLLLVSAGRFAAACLRLGTQQLKKESGLRWGVGF